MGQGTEYLFDCIVLGIIGLVTGLLFRAFMQNVLTVV